MFGRLDSGAHSNSLKSLSVVTLAGCSREFSLARSGTSSRRIGPGTARGTDLMEYERRQHLQCVLGWNLAIGLSVLCLMVSLLATFLGILVMAGTLEDVAVDPDWIVLSGFVEDHRWIIALPQILMVSPVVSWVVAVNRYKHACQTAGVPDAATASRLLGPARGGRMLAWKQEASSALGCFRAAMALQGPVAVEPLPPPPSEDEIRRSVATALSTARKLQAYTQEHLAKAAGVSPRTVQRVEASGRIAFESLRGLCAVLQIAVPVPEGRTQAVEAPALWKGLVTPVATASLIAVSFVFLAGWYWRSWRSRTIHVACGVAASLVLGCMGWRLRNPLDAGAMDLWWAVVSFPASAAIGSALLGVAWRSASSRSATLVAVVALGIIAMPSIHLIQAHDELEQQAVAATTANSAIQSMRMAASFAEAGVDQDCQEFLVSDYANMTSSGNIGPQDQSERFANYMEAGAREHHAEGMVPTGSERLGHKALRDMWNSCMQKTYAAWKSRVDTKPSFVPDRPK